jgi:hypothetical protein
MAGCGRGHRYWNCCRHGAIRRGRGRGGRVGCLELAGVDSDQGACQCAGDELRVARRHGTILRWAAYLLAMSEDGGGGRLLSRERWSGRCRRRCRRARRDPERVHGWDEGERIVPEEEAHLVPVRQRQRLSDIPWSGRRNGSDDRPRRKQRGRGGGRGLTRPTIGTVGRQSRAGARQAADTRRGSSDTVAERRLQGDRWRQLPRECRHRRRFGRRAPHQPSDLHAQGGDPDRQRDAAPGPWLCSSLQAPPSSLPAVHCSLSRHAIDRRPGAPAVRDSPRRTAQSLASQPNRAIVSGMVRWRNFSPARFLIGG